MPRAGEEGDKGAKTNGESAPRIRRPCSSSAKSATESLSKSATTSKVPSKVLSFANAQFQERFGTFWRGRGTQEAENGVKTNDNTASRSKKPSIKTSSPPVTITTDKEHNPINTLFQERFGIFNRGRGTQTAAYGVKTNGETVSSSTANAVKTKRAPTNGNTLSMTTKSVTASSSPPTTIHKVVHNSVNLQFQERFGTFKRGRKMVNGMKADGERAALSTKSATKSSSQRRSSVAFTTSTTLTNSKKPAIPAPKASLTPASTCCPTHESMSARTSSSPRKSKTPAQEKLGKTKGGRVVKRDPYDGKKVDGGDFIRRSKSSPPTKSTAAGRGNIAKVKFLKTKLKASGRELVSCRWEVGTPWESQPRQP